MREVIDIRISKLVFILIVIMTVGCNKKTDQKKYYWLLLRQDNYNLPAYNMIDTVAFSFFERDSRDTVQLHYLFGQNRHSYFLSKHKGDGLISTNPRDSFLHPNDTAYFLRCFLDTTFTLDTTRFHLRKFIMDEDIADGSTIHYYEERLGVFAMHSGYWPGIKIIQSNDDTYNERVRKLVKLCAPEFFVRKPL
jgi:hypothetical protein